MHIFLTGPLQSGKSTAIAHYLVGRPEAPGGFRTRWDRAGGHLALELLDELGFLERCSPVFQRAVFTLLGGPTPVLGVLRRHAKSPFWGPVSRRADVRLLPLTVENRAEIPTELARLLG